MWVAVRLLNEDVYFLIKKLMPKHQAVRIFSTANGIRVSNNCKCCNSLNSKVLVSGADYSPYAFRSTAFQLAALKEKQA